MLPISSALLLHQTPNGFCPRQGRRKSVRTAIHPPSPSFNDHRIAPPEFTHLGLPFSQDPPKTPTVSHVPPRPSPSRSISPQSGRLSGWLERPHPFPANTLNPKTPVNDTLLRSCRSPFQLFGSHLPVPPHSICAASVRDARTPTVVG